MPEPPLVRRRTAVLGMTATLLLTGCDHGDDLGGPGANSGPTTATTTPSTPPKTPDELLVEAVTGELNTALGVLLTVRQTRGLRPVVLPLVRAHRQHLVALDGDPTGSGPGPAVLPELRSVLASERRLRSALVDAAGRAESGALAKLLASMSASVTQHLDALPAAA